MRTRIRPQLRIGGSGSRRPGARLARVLGLALLLSSTSPHAAGRSAEALVEPGPQAASVEVTLVAGWVLASGDNGDMPFVIVDKVNARVLVFDASGRLQGAAAALLGMARGDRSIEGIGERPLSAITPEHRITPAGRFLASLDHDAGGKQVLLIDYAAAIALHPVITGHVSERRAQRLHSATSQDNRISYGCINVPARFFEDVVRPAFTHTTGIVYVLPEMSRAMDLFGNTDGR